jgi:hypothetical protein
MTTTNDTPAQRLRVALKSAGFNARQVSVRYPHSTLHVTIRDASVSLTKVSAIAGAFESVSRDYKSGEILCGGNTFVRVEYADALVDPVKATILAVLDPAPNDEYVALPGGFRAMKCTREHGGASHVWEVRMEGCGFDLYNNLAVGVTWAAERLAVAYLDASALGTRQRGNAEPCTPGDAFAGAPRN